MVEIDYRITTHNYFRYQMDNSINKTSNDVLKIYKKVNPSRVERISEKKNRIDYVEKWKNLIVKKLLLPPLLFQNSILLDVGCGTGEKSMVYATLGAKVIGLDFNEEAIAIAKSNAEIWGLFKKTEFHVSSVFDIQINSAFDIIVSDGVIHHTADPKKAFDNFAILLKPGGVLLLGLAEPCGFFQRQLQRYFVNRIANSKDEEILTNIAVILFREELERASKVSGRSIKATVYDSFINPQIVPIAFHDVKKWMNEHNIYLDCTWPPSELPLQNDSQYHPLLGSTNPSILGWETLTRVFWMLNNKYDKDLFDIYTNYNVNLSNFLDQAHSMCSDTSLNTKVLEETLNKVKRIETSPLPGLLLKKILHFLLKKFCK